MADLLTSLTDAAAAAKTLIARADADAAARIRAEDALARSNAEIARLTRLLEDGSVVIPPPPAPTEPPSGPTITADPKALQGPRKILQLFKNMAERDTKKVVIGGHMNSFTWSSDGVSKLARANALLDGAHLGLMSYGTASGTEKTPTGYIRHIAEQAEGGAIIVLDFGPANPANNLGTGNTTTAADIISMKDVSTPGHALNKKYLANVDLFITNYLVPLGKAGVTVIVRPLYEANNSGWWYAKNPGGAGNRGPDGKAASSDWTYDRYKALYRQTWDQIVKVRGCHNVLSAWTGHFSWDQEGANGMGSQIKMYPGQDYVDIIGGSLYDLSDNLAGKIDHIRQLADAFPQHPLGALEAGRSQKSGSPKADLNIWKAKLLPKLPVTSVMFWNNSHDLADQLAAADLLCWPGNMTAQDVKRELDSMR